MASCANKIRQALELIVKERGETGRDLHPQIESLRATIGAKITKSFMKLLKLFTLSVLYILGELQLLTHQTTLKMR